MFDVYSNDSENYLVLNAKVVKLRMVSLKLLVRQHVELEQWSLEMLMIRTVR